MFELCLGDIGDDLDPLSVGEGVSATKLARTKRTRPTRVAIDITAESSLRYTRKIVGTCVECRWITDIIKVLEGVRSYTCPVR